MFDPAALQMTLMVLTGWRERQAIAYLVEENRRRRLLHDGSLDVVRLGDLLHGVCR